jgi:hypothetical protein
MGKYMDQERERIRKLRAEKEAARNPKPKKRPVREDEESRPGYFRRTKGKKR